MTAKTIKDMTTLKAYHGALDAELKEVFARYGLAFSGSSARIGMGECILTCKTKTGGEEEQQKVQAERWAMYAEMLGLPVDGFGKRYNLQGHVFEVIGCDPGKPKNCALIRRVSDGKEFKCPPTSLRNRVA